MLLYVATPPSCYYLLDFLYKVFLIISQHVLSPTLSSAYLYQLFLHLKLFIAGTHRHKVRKINSDYPLARLLLSEFLEKTKQPELGDDEEGCCSIVSHAHFLRSAPFMPYHEL